LSKKAYLITRSVVALAAVAVFFWLFLVPPTITSGGGNEYSSCHPVGWNFVGDIDPLLNDSFDVENPSEVQRYVDDATSAKYEIETHPKITRDIQRLCHEARLERSVLIVSSLIVFAVVFVSVPKPRLPKGSVDGESSDAERQLKVSGKEAKR
jgi:mesoderm induction early response protein 1